MKKFMLVMLLMVAAGSFTMAQNYESIVSHNVGDYTLDVRNIMPMRDGNCLVNCQLFTSEDVGNVFYKISPNAVITDSVFVEDKDLNQFLLEPNPVGDDYIYAKAVRNLEQGRTDFCIQFFNANLDFEPEKEVWVPLCNAISIPLAECYCLDSNGDIIVYLPIDNQESHLFRIALNGEMKCHTVISDLPFNSWECMPRLGVYNDAGDEYFVWGLHHDTEGTNLRVVVLNSDLQTKDILTPEMSAEYVFGYQDGVMNWNNNAFLLTSRYDYNAWNSNDKSHGVRVALYDKTTMEILNTHYFSSCPETVETNLHAFPIGFAKGNDGCFYYAYSGYTSETFEGQLCMVKMDADFNILWQRFCLEPVGYYPEGTRIAAIKDGGAVIAGFTADEEENTGLMCLVFKGTEGNTSTVENNGIRPYAFYPNPVSETLNIYYSPDVKPNTVELYDLQGRLVVNCHNNLESINTASLAEGVYTVRVTLEDGTSYTDQIVKR